MTESGSANKDQQYELNNGTIITQRQIDYWNNVLQQSTPLELLKWAKLTFPNLSQITAFGLSGLVIIDLLNSLKTDTTLENNDSRNIPLIFVDTLHHFPQTYELLEKIEKKYYTTNKSDDTKNVEKILVYKPLGCKDETDFIKENGDFLWEKDETKYDYLVKVEPLNRAYKDLQIDCVFTGRRRSQGGSRAELPIVEIDEINKVIKINPLHSWSFSDVKEYIDTHGVPYNELLDLGYKSVGDYHSTVPSNGQDDDERGGRWNGKVKTECGIHDPKRFLKYMEAKK